MQQYKGVSGDAGVTHYKTAPDSITLRFKNRTVYLYNYAQTGKTAVEAMKKLAVKGKGLTTYINQQVRSRYAKRLK